MRIREIRIISPDGTVPFGIKNADDEEDEDEPSMYDRSPGGDDGGGRDYEMDKDHSDPDSRKRTCTLLSVRRLLVALACRIPSRFPRPCPRPPTADKRCFSAFYSSCLVLPSLLS